jgi:hypothetical protein
MTAQISPPTVNWSELFELYISILSRFLDIANIRDKASHPLVITIEHLKEMRDMGVATELGLHIGQYGPGTSGAKTGIQRTLRTLFSLGLDSMYWLGPRGSYIKQLESDPSIRKFPSSRLPKTEMCEDVLAELHYWGWLKARGFEASLTEYEGMPDIYVRGHNVTLHAEVKAIHESSGPDRVRKVIEKANKQIKRTKEQVGICVIRYTEAIATDCEQKSIPLQIQAIINCASSAMNSNNYKSVSKTIIYWDEYTTRGSPPGWVLLFGIRRSHGIDHANARHSISISTELLPVATFAGNMFFRERAI